uniref:transposase n=1 Tax=Salinicoccus albus TaxID=418756 RepID=UPI000380A8AB
MATLPQISLDFNRKIKRSNDGGALSSDTGTLRFREFDETIGFSKTIAEHLHLRDNRLYHIHSNDHLLRQKLYQMIAGYAEDDAADQLTEDPVFTQVIDAGDLASQPSLSRFWSRFDDASIEQLDR